MDAQSTISIDPAAAMNSESTSVEAGAVGAGPTEILEERSTTAVHKPVLASSALAGAATRAPKTCFNFGFWSNEPPPYGPYFMPVAQCSAVAAAAELCTVMDPSVIGFRGHHISDSEDFESSSAASFTDRSLSPMPVIPKRTRVARAAVENTTKEAKPSGRKDLTVDTQRKRSTNKDGTLTGSSGQPSKAKGVGGVPSDKSSKTNPSKKIVKKKAKAVTAAATKVRT